MSPSLTSFAVQHTLVDFVSFTGSVAGGHSVARLAVNGPGFTGVGLEVRFPVFFFLFFFPLVRYSPWTC
jgi:hypothetical protein